MDLGLANRSLRVVVLVTASTLASSVVRADPEPQRRGEASAELSMHFGEVGQDESHPMGIYPAILVGGGWQFAPNLEVRAKAAASAAVAEWANIEGIANGYLGIRRTGVHDRTRYHVELGATVPLGAPLPPPKQCASMPDQPPGDSFVYDFTGDGQCWDRSGYRRAALNRGAWDVWMWAPDWVTAVVTGELVRQVSPTTKVSARAGLGVGVGVTALHEGDRAVVAQLSLGVRSQLSPEHELGIRLLHAGVYYADNSPLITSVEPSHRWRRGRYGVETRFTLPVKDHRNPPVSPGLGNYQITDEWGLTTGLVVAF